MIQPHRWDPVSHSWMLEPRLNECLTGLLGREPYAVQTMVYFKPAGSRGQALHQDNYYLRAQPGTCMAAWMALDPCDEANGCMQVVPGSHPWDILCTETADTTVSFTDVTVPLPPGAQPQSVVMDAGDVLFFNGSIVHGSFPNQTTDRFRRSLVGALYRGRLREGLQGLSAGLPHGWHAAGAGRQPGRQHLRCVGGAGRGGGAGDDRRADGRAPLARPSALRQVGQVVRVFVADAGGLVESQVLAADDGHNYAVHHSREPIRVSLGEGDG